MTARKDLYAFAMQGKEHSPANSEKASQKIDAYRAAVVDELLQERAAMLRAYPDYRGVMDLAASLLLGEDHPHRRQADGEEAVKDAR